MAGGPEAGLTLIELAIVLVILPLLMAAIAVALIVTLTDQTGVQTRLSDSVDSQITSAFFVRDVQSAQYVTTTSAPAVPPWQTPTSCGTDAGSNFVVGLAWPGGTASHPTQETVVSYWRAQLFTGTGSTSGHVLTSSAPVFRLSDVGLAVVQIGGTGSIPAGATIKSVQSATSATLTGGVTAPTVHFIVDPQLVRDVCKGASQSSTAVSHDFFSPFTEAVVSCVTAVPACTTGIQAHWVHTLGVSTVTLGVMEPAGHYDYNLTAAPRISNARGSLLGGCVGLECFPSIPTLLLLSNTVIAESSNGRTSASITVVGTAVINTGYFKMHTGTTFTATTATPTKGKIKTFETPTTKVCTQPGAQCPTPPTRGITPYPPEHLPAPVADPLAGLADPGPLPVQPCPGGGGTISSAVTLLPGQYTCLLTVSGNHGMVTLQSGIYEFDQGVSVTGGAALDGTSNVMIYLPCKQVDGWAPSCTEQFTASNAKVTAKRMITGPYLGLWFWQNKGDIAPDHFSGQNSLRATGVMYAPGATVELGGLGTSTTPVGSIIASTLSVSNSHIEITG